MFDALTIAQYVINRCVKLGKPISNLQLQKILFCIQKEFASQRKVAFYDRFEKFPFGPAIPSVYYRYCGFAALPIDIRYDDVTFGKYDVVFDKIIDEKIDLMPWEFKKWMDISYD